ncbi:hypothetical protein CRUP_021017 [Coryphaenoides rupestris]|nr:hypothetical protein CRUP_021017 [Coryphaenoides rupestris]
MKKKKEKQQPRRNSCLDAAMLLIPSLVWSR